MTDCNNAIIHHHFKGQEVTLTCENCGLELTIPFSHYDSKWGFPKAKEEMSVAEWLHKIEDTVGRDRMMKTKIGFYDAETQVVLGYSMIPFSAIEKLNIGDVIEFKESASLFGQFKIESFAVNQGHPEGTINLRPFKSRAKIKLNEINEEHLDLMLPF